MYAEMHAHPVAVGTGAVATSPARPRRARVPGTGLGRGSGGREEVTCLRESRPSPPPEPPGLRPRCCSLPSWAETRRVWLRDSGGGGGGPGSAPGVSRRSRPVRSVCPRGPSKVSTSSKREAILHQTGNLIMIILFKSICTRNTDRIFRSRASLSFPSDWVINFLWWKDKWYV